MAGPKKKVRAPDKPNSSATSGVDAGEGLHPNGRRAPSNGTATGRPSVDDETKRRRLERRLTREIRKWFGKGPADYTPEDWRGLREQLRLALLYPGRCVAFRDHFRGPQGAQRLVRREVLADAESMAEINDFIDALPEAERMGIGIDYMEPPDAV